LERPAAGVDLRGVAVDLRVEETGAVCVGVDRFLGVAR
jgi:hypothetical protein